jgi:hypothetical protein
VYQEPVGGASPPRFCPRSAARRGLLDPWRLAYYGHLLPNAVVAKSGADLGWQFRVGWTYFISFVLAQQAILVILPVAVYLLISRRRQAENWAFSTIWLVLLIASVNLLFFIGTGGDWMPAWRFFAPVVPLLAAATAAAWGTIRPRADITTRFGVIVTAGVSLLMLSVSTSHPEAKPRIEAWRLQIDDLSDMGAWVRRTLPEGTVISTYANGALSYEAGPGIIVVDQLGLTDEHIARHGKRLRTGVVGHLAYDYDYVVNVRRPEVVFVTGGEYWQQIDCIVPLPFVEHYRAAAYQVRGEARWATVYLRTENWSIFADLLDRDPAFRRVPCPADG